MQLPQTGFFLYQPAGGAVVVKSTFSSTPKEYHVNKTSNSLTGVNGMISDKSCAKKPSHCHSLQKFTMVCADFLLVPKNVIINWTGLSWNIGRLHNSGMERWLAIISHFSVSCRKTGRTPRIHFVSWCIERLCSCIHRLAE